MDEYTTKAMIGPEKFYGVCDTYNLVWEVSLLKLYF